MPYTIEVISIGQDFYPLIESAASSLNAAQKEFVFEVPSARLKHEGLPFQRKQYRTHEVFDFLRSYRAQAKGHRPFLIGVLKGPLESDRLQNLFGSHEAEEGLAIINVLDCNRYADSELQFLRYYFIRYSLSFIAPQLKVHQEARSCFFDAKLYKFDLRKSIGSGDLCDECMSVLQRNFNPEIYGAVGRMVDVLRGGFGENASLALIMKGGGIKGLAYVGALEELEKYYHFDWFIGTSAGAITAVLLAGGYTMGELKTTLKALFNLLFHHGLYPAGTFTKWLDDLLAAKLKSAKRVTLASLPHRATVYASRREKEALIFDGRDPATSRTSAAFAARCSMAIPLVFTPERDEGMNVFDGGLRHNYPVEALLGDPSQKFIGLYLGPRIYEGKAKPHGLLSDLSSIFLEAADADAIEKYRDSTIIIDARPISTLDFALTVKEKEFLLNEGRASALEFLAGKVKHVSAETVAAARAEAESARQEVTALRKAKSRRWAWRLSLLALLVIAAGFAVSRFPRRIPSEVQLLSPRLSELDSTLQSLEDNNLKEARRESDASVRLVSYVLQLRWHTPKHFAAKTFGVRIESLKYDIVGFAARFENKHGQQAPIDPCSVAPKSLSFELPSDSSPTYVFIRLKAPKDYSFPDILKLLTAHPGRAGSVCSGN
jgi:predicted acylesterase/phospholipase RssA